MKIIRVIARLNVGGPARQVVWLNEALQNDEFDSVLLAGIVPTGEENMGYFAEERGVEPIFIEEMSRELSLGDLVSLWKVYRQLLREKPDIIHTHTAKAGTIGRTAGFFYRWFTLKTLVGQPRKVKIVHTFHGHIFHSYYGKLKTKVFLIIEKCLARFVTDKIIVISGQQEQEICSDFGVGRKEQFEVIPLGIDLTQFEKPQDKKEILRAEIGAKDDDILIGLVGRLTEVKNHELFLRVAKIYKERKDLDFPKLKFIVLGDGHLRGDLEKKASKLRIGDIVQFLGNRNDPEVCYAGLDIIALTSLNEGTPLTLIEAMASETPVISTNVGGVVDLLGEVLEDRDGFELHERGISVSSFDAEDYFRGLTELIENEKLRKELGEAGKIFVHTYYSKDRLIKDISSLYRKLQND